jgi:hypothetical protein
MRKGDEVQHYLQYPGAFINNVTIAGQVGQYLTTNFGVIATQELHPSPDSSAGTVTAANSNTVMNAVGGFGGVFWNSAKFSASSNGVVDQFSIQLANNGAAMEYGVGSASAAGVIPGTLEVSGQLRMFFSSFTLFDAFKSETAGTLALIARDSSASTANSYAISLPNVQLLNPRIQAGGINQPVYATFDIEGSPATQTGFTGSVRVDRLNGS